MVGSLFSWLNRGGQDDYTSLHSEQLNKYAETVEATAESADTPYTCLLYTSSRKWDAYAAYHGKRSA